jgi:glycosyltransferase involved in cell wall biosynthesis
MKKISVIIPCRNEEKHILTCVLSLLNNGYPKELLEILVIDGLSTDNTLYLLEELCKKYSNVKVVINEKVKTPFALNLGIQHASGDYILIASAHSAFDPGYIGTLESSMHDLKADVVGGVMRTKVKNSTPISEAIKMVLSNSFGVGNAVFRTGTSEVRKVDTVPFGLYRTDLLKSLGGYNTRLIRNHDIELSKRLLHQKASIYLTPEATCSYFARESFSKLAKNNFDNGKWNILTIYITKDLSSISLRHFIPFLFLISLVATIFFALIFPPFLYLTLFVLLLYCTALIYVVSKIDRAKTSFFYLCITFMVLHISYGFGSLVGLFGFRKLIK